MLQEELYGYRGLFHIEVGTEQPRLPRLHSICVDTEELNLTGIMTLFDDEYPKANKEMMAAAKVVVEKFEKTVVSLAIWEE